MWINCSKETEDDDDNDYRQTADSYAMEDGHASL